MEYISYIQFFAHVDLSGMLVAVSEVAYYSLVSLVLVGCFLQVCAPSANRTLHCPAKPNNKLYPAVNYIWFGLPLGLEKFPHAPPPQNTFPPALFEPAPGLAGGLWPARVHSLQL